MDPAGLLVSSDFAWETGLREGSDLFLVLEGAHRPVNFVIKGIVDYFPTLHPEDGYFFVGNLDYVYDAIGIQPYDIWARLADGAMSTAVVEALSDQGFVVTSAVDTRLAVAAQRITPQSTALSGMLSVGFVVAILMSGFGFLFNALLSLRQRLPSLGILRALGLSIRQLGISVLFESLLLGVLGVVGGTLIGTCMVKLFSPLSQVGSPVPGAAPPMRVVPAWDQMLKVYSVLGCLALVTVGSLAWRLFQLRIYEAVRLGERM
jgi:putative ABC transport system permease protein